MYVRKKPNRSGSTSIVVIEKRAGKVCYLKTIGVSSDVQEIEDLYFQGKKWILQQKCERDMFLEQTRKVEEKEVVETNHINHSSDKKCKAARRAAFFYIHYSHLEICICRSSSNNQISK